MVGTGIVAMKFGKDDGGLTFDSKLPPVGGAIGGAFCAMENRTCFRVLFFFTFSVLLTWSVCKIYFVGFSFNDFERRFAVRVVLVHFYFEKRSIFIICCRVQTRLGIKN